MLYLDQIFSENSIMGRIAINTINCNNHKNILNILTKDYTQISIKTFY